LRLTRLHVQNFKSLRDITIQPNRILTILIGPNSAGKSNILDALKFVSQVTRSTQQEYIENRGGPRAIVFAGNPNGQILIELELEMDDDEMNAMIKGVTESIAFSEIKTIWQPKWVYEVRFGWSGSVFTMLSESIWTWIAGQRVEYAESSWKDRAVGKMYSYQVIKSIVDGITKKDWTLMTEGGQAPPQSILLGADYKRRPEWYPIKELAFYFRNFSHLAAIRESPELAKLIGRYELVANAENLPQVLHTLASSNRVVFQAILEDVSTLLPEFAEVRSLPIEGRDETYLSTKEQPWPEFELLWRNVASGTRDAICLLTFLHITPDGSLLLIDEPGQNLHAVAVARLRKIMERIAVKHRKQVIASTHSTTLVDDAPFDQIVHLRSEAGATKVLDAKSFAEAERLIAAARIPKSSILAASKSVLVFLVEGRDDAKVWRQLLLRSGVDPDSGPIKIVSGYKAGGREDVLNAISFLKRIGPPISYYAVLDGDGESELRQQMKDEDISGKNVHFLSQGEIEDYLMEPQAISALTNRGKLEVEAIIAEVKGRGKHRLETILKRLGISRVSSEVMELLVCHLSEVPLEMRQIIQDIESRATVPL
jgi:predicted ATPase